MFLTLEDEEDAARREDLECDVAAEDEEVDPDAASPEVTASAEGSVVSAAAAGQLGNALDEVLASATIADAGGGDYYVKGDAEKKVVGTIRDIGRGVKATCYQAPTLQLLDHFRPVPHAQGRCARGFGQVAELLQCRTADRG